MFKSLLASTLLVGALTLPAAADSFDFRTVGGGAYGYQDAGRGGWNGGDRGPARDWRLSPRQLVRGLRYRGFQDVEIIRDRADVAIVRASARGRDMILVVDARSGEVLRQRPAEAWGGRGWRGGFGGNGGFGQDWGRW